MPFKIKLILLNLNNIFLFDLNHFFLIKKWLAVVESELGEVGHDYVFELVLKL